MRASQLAQARERVVLEYQLQNRVTGNSFQPCFEAGIRELPFSSSDVQQVSGAFFSEDAHCVVVQKWEEELVKAKATTFCTAYYVHVFNRNGSKCLYMERFTEI